MRMGKQERKKVEKKQRFYLRCRGEQAVALEILVNRDFVYGQKLAPVDQDAWELATLCRVSLWTSEEEWKKIYDVIHDWDNSWKEGCFYWEQLKARRELEEKVQLPWSLMVEDLHLRRRRAIIKSRRKAGFLRQPEAGEDLEPPVLRDWAVAIDGGGRSTSKKKEEEHQQAEDQEEKEEEPRELRGAGAWTFSSPSGIKIAEGGVPMWEVGYRAGALTGHHWKQWDPLEEQDVEWGIPWGVLNPSSGTGEMLPLLHFL